jgi:hypothetical protein
METFMEINEATAVQPAPKSGKRNYRSDLRLKFLRTLKPGDPLQCTVVRHF